MTTSHCLFLENQKTTPLLIQKCVALHQFTDEVWKHSPQTWSSPQWALLWWETASFSNVVFSLDYCIDFNLSCYATIRRRTFCSVQNRLSPFRKEMFFNLTEAHIIFCSKTFLPTGLNRVLLILSAHETEVRSLHSINLSIKWFEIGDTALYRCHVYVFIWQSEEEILWSWQQYR